MATTDPVTDVEADHRLWRYTIYPDWLTDAQGNIVPDAEHHEGLWQWVWSIRKGQRAPAFVAVWARGGAKSTSAELAATALGARRTRRYAWYVCGTQDQADDHVASIAGMLETPTLGAFYPALASRRLTKYGYSAGWRGNRLTTQQPFTVDAVGLDKAVRGRRSLWDRPDLIILDDVDDPLDSPPVTDRKITAITKKILPAGSSDSVVLAIQNLVHPNSVFARLVDGRADYLQDRILSGPIPAIAGLEVSQGPDLRWYITAGHPTWIGFDLETAQAKMHEEGLTAFLTERQHQVEPPAGGMYDHLDFAQFTVDPTRLPELVRAVVWVDPAISSTDGSDCQAIQADALGTDGIIYRLFSWEQRSSPEETLERAILKAAEIGADRVGIETDQGGDAWRSVYREAARHLRQSGQMPAHLQPPTARDAKAGAGGAPKTHRASLMLADYERGRIRHVRGTTITLERALRRFPRTKPFDLVDAAYWSWADLRTGGIGGAAHDAEVPAPRGSASWDRDDPYAAARQSRWQT